MDVFTALSDPTRRKVLDLLRAKECSAGELVAAVPHLTQPAVSKHLRILREVGLVAVEPRAQTRVYSLQPQKLSEVDAWLSNYRQFWNQRVDALEEHLDRRYNKPRGKAR